MREDKRIPIMELFGPTFQGEGALCGVQTYFVRSGLCDYKCTMCDSMHAVDPAQVKHLATWMTMRDLGIAFDEYTSKQTAPQYAPWMTLTGGNPCIHDFSRFVEYMHALEIRVNVETQGTLCPDWLLICDLVTISPKSPGMGENFDQDAFRHMIRTLGAHVEIAVKVVVFDAVDLEFAHLVFSILDEEIDSLLEGEHFPQINKFLSLGNPYPPQSRNLQALNDVVQSSTLDDEIRLRLLHNFKHLCEDILNDNRFRDVIFLPQLHVLTWANLQKV